MRSCATRVASSCAAASFGHSLPSRSGIKSSRVLRTKWYWGTRTSPHIIWTSKTLNSKRRVEGKIPPPFSHGAESGVRFFVDPTPPLLHLQLPFSDIFLFLSFLSTKLLATKLPIARLSSTE